MNKADLAANFCRDGYVNLCMAYMDGGSKEARSDEMSQYVSIGHRAGFSIFIAAFACEQLLKCLVLCEAKDFQKVHGLDKIFDLLSSEKRSSVDKLWDDNSSIRKTHGTPPNEVPLDFMEHLTAISEDFVKYRYCVSAKDDDENEDQAKCNRVTGRRVMSCHISHLFILP